MMDSSVTRLNELGFAEFTASLISQTLDAVIGSYIDQERKLAELVTAIQMPPEEYAVKFIDGAAVRAEVIRLFPAAGDGDKSAVDPGCAYRPASPRAAELPAVRELTGYEMIPADIEQALRRRLTITRAGYDAVCRQVSITLAIRQQEALRVIRDRGLPRVLVDFGKINTKLTFKLIESSNKPESAPSAPSVSIVKALPLKRVMVEPINARGAEYLSMQTNITSEVEITFKTITS